MVKEVYDVASVDVSSRHFRVAQSVVCHRSLRKSNEVIEERMWNGGGMDIRVETELKRGVITVANLGRNLFGMHENSAGRVNM